MDPQMLVDPGATAPLPAPFWFIQFFKVLGFSLHMVPMNLWFAGLLVAMLFRAGGGSHAVLFSRRLMRQMPILIAYGVNFGIVPLLFVQLAYYQFFYPATIVMGWWWMAIVGLLIPAYYGVYFYSLGLHADDPDGPAPLRVLVGWASAVCFILIGFLLVNGFSMMGNPEAWSIAMADHSTSGAAIGSGLNMDVQAVLARLLIMFSLALGTTAAWMVFDAAWFAAGETDDYRRWAVNRALTLALIGATGFAAAGSWYVFGSWTSDLRDAMFAGPAVILTVLTAVAPGLTAVLLLIARQRGLTRGVATLIGLGQFGVLAVNAVSRQVVQNIRVGAYADLTARPAEIQWSPLVLFLVLFVLGALVILWMAAQVVKAAKTV